MRPLTITDGDGDRMTVEEGHASDEQPALKFIINSVGYSPTSVRLEREVLKLVQAKIAEFLVSHPE